MHERPRHRSDYDGGERTELPLGREDVMEDRRDRVGRSGGMGAARRGRDEAPRGRGPSRVVGRLAVGLLAVVLVGCPSVVDPPVTTVTVEGRVLAADGTPLAGVLAHAQGALTTTEADGAFRLEGIAPPYTLTLGSGGSAAWVHAYEGLTSTAPLLVPLGPTSDGYATALAGTLLGLGALPDDERVVVGVEGLSAPVAGYGFAGVGDTSYTGFATWTRPAASAPVRLHALRIQVDALERPLAYFGYDAVDATLVDGTTTTTDVMLNQSVANARLEGTVAVAGGGALDYTHLVARFGASYGLPFYLEPASAALSVPAPEIGDGSVLAVAEATYAHGTTLAWTTVPVGPTFALEVPPPPQLLAPVPGASGVMAADAFRVEGGPTGARLFVWRPVAAADGPAMAVTTAGDIARLPDVTPFGLALVPGGRYLWSVRALAAENYAAAISVPSIERFVLLFVLPETVPQDGAIATTSSRAMTLAP
jgi:hypothetical protein